MLRARTCSQVDKARQAIVRIGKLSDDIVGVGPFGIGVDGLLAWLPGLGDLYSLGAGGLLIVLGLRARAPLATLVQVGLIVGLRTAVGAAALPLLGPIYPVAGVLVDLFRGHKLSATLLARALDNTCFLEGPNRDLNGEPDVQRAVGAAKANSQRVVFLG